MSRALVFRSIALAVLVAVLALRSNSRGDDPTSATKSRANSPAETASKSETKLAPEQARETAVEHALGEPAQFNFVNTPLKQVAAFLEAHYKISVSLDTESLEDGKVTPDTVINESIDHVPLRSALYFALAAKDLAYIEGDNGELLITTAEIAKQKVTTRVYDLWNFAAPPIDGLSPRSVSSAEFDEIIRANVAPQSWSDNGGPGSSMFVDSELVVSQTAEVQLQIAKLLAGLRKVRTLDAATMRKGGGPTVVFPTQTAAEARIEQVLESRRDFDFTDVPLSGVAKTLAEKLGIAIQLDSKALADAGVSDELRLSVHATQVPVWQGLRRLLKGRDLGFMVDHDALVITTADTEKTKTVLGIYPVADLIGDDDSNASGQCDYDSLIEAITCTVAPSKWGSGTGPGPISPVGACDALVFPQTREVHRQVKELLEALRAAKKDRVQPTGAVESSSVVEVYPLNTGLATDEKGKQQIVDTIRKVVEPKSWTEPEAYIGMVPGAIVVRQTPKVHRGIRWLLMMIENQPRSGGFQNALTVPPTPAARNAAKTGGGQSQKPK